MHLLCVIMTSSLMTFKTAESALKDAFSFPLFFSFDLKEDKWGCN